MDDCLMIFAKAPELGAVKTRLALPPAKAVALHRAFVSDVVNATMGFWQQVLWATDESHPFFTQFDQPLRRQRGIDLGERMAYAFRESLVQYERVVVIGTDAPHLPAYLIRDAFDALKLHDVVIGPSCDGGYYLLGLKRFLPDLFEPRIGWSGADVFSRTLAVLRDAQITPHILPFWFDVDRPEDLRRLAVWPSYGQLAQTKPLLSDVDLFVDEDS